MARNHRLTGHTQPQPHGPPLAGGRLYGDCSDSSGGDQRIDMILSYTTDSIIGHNCITLCGKLYRTVARVAAHENGKRAPACA